VKNVMIAAAVVLGLAAVPAMAQTQQQSTTTKTKSTQSTRAHKASNGATMDQQFVKKAAEGGMAEVQLGKLAQDKASNDQVKKFAERMVTDHGKANDELKTLAQNKNIQLPSNLSPKDQALHDRLAKLSGEQFDRAYMQAMLKDHRADVNEFKKASQTATDPDVKAFAAKTLPTLEEHLQLAQQDAKAVGTSGTKPPKKP